MPEIFVLMWKCCDNSSFGIVSAYEKEGDVMRDIELLRQHGDTSKNFYITTTLLK